MSLILEKIHLHELFKTSYEAIDFLQIVTVSFCVLLTAFYASAVYDPTSYAGEQIEILLAGKMKSISDYLHTTTRAGTSIVID